MITQTYNGFAEVSGYCGKVAKDYYTSDDAVPPSRFNPQGVPAREVSWLRCIGKEVGCRLLYLAQTIASLVMLPLNLLAMIPFSIAALCVEGPKEGWELFKATCFAEWIHYAFLPHWILGIALPQYAGM